MMVVSVLVLLVRFRQQELQDVLQELVDRKRCLPLAVYVRAGRDLIFLRRGEEVHELSLELD